MPRVEIVAAGFPGEDRQPMIQLALDAVAKAGGGEVFLPDGEYIIGPGDGMVPPAPPPATNNPGMYSLKIGNNTHLRMGPATTLVRRFKGGYGTIMNSGLAATPQSSNTNITVSGGTIKTVNVANEGKHLDFARVTRLAVRDTQFTGVSKDWNTAFVDCNDVTVSGVFMDSGDEVGEDGLHFKGGSRIAVDNCVITSGDDAMSLTQEGDNTTDMSDVVISNCTLVSKKANALRIWAHNAPGTAKFITRVRVANCVGQSGTEGSGGGRGIEIVDEQNQKRITDVDVDGFTLNGQYNGAEAFRIFGVSRVRMRGVVCRSPNVGGLIDSSDEVELVDCSVESPRGGTAACLKVAQTALCLDTRILGGRYLAGKANGIVLGSASAQAVRPQVANARIANVTGSGLLATSAILALVCDNHIFGCTSYGIEEGLGAVDNAYIANYFYANGGTGGPILLLGARAYAIRNVAQPATPIFDTGGFRQTIDGWSFANLFNSGGGVMGRATGRFRVPRDGSVTGIVANLNNPWTAGSLTIVIMRNSGNAGAVGVPLTGIILTFAGLPSPNKVILTVPQDTVNCSFAAGDELYLTIGGLGWNVGGVASNVDAAIEIET